MGVVIPITTTMAGDTRDGLSPSQSTPPLPPPGATSPPPHITSSSPKIYEVFNAPSSSSPSAPSQSGPISANALPEGSGQNTAGANQETPTLATAIKTVRIQDFKQVHMYPCVRESLLMGIGGALGCANPKSSQLGRRNLRLRLLRQLRILPLQTSPRAPTHETRSRDHRSQESGERSCGEG